MTQPRLELARLEGIEAEVVEQIFAVFEFEQLTAADEQHHRFELGVAAP